MVMAPSSLVAIETGYWTGVVVVEGEIGTEVEVADELLTASELVEDVVVAVSTGSSSTGEEMAEAESSFELPLTT
jgi:S-adenosylmethionine synthetase